MSNGPLQRMQKNKGANYLWYPYPYRNITEYLPTKKNRLGISLCDTAASFAENYFLEEIAHMQIARCLELGEAGRYCVLHYYKVSIQIVKGRLKEGRLLLPFIFFFFLYFTRFFRDLSSGWMVDNELYPVDLPYNITF